MNHAKECGPLKAIYWNGTDDEAAVVRWCPQCGAVVVDTDFDGRTNPGAIMKMKFPQRR